MSVIINNPIIIILNNPILKNINHKSPTKNPLIYKIKIR